MFKIQSTRISVLHKAIFVAASIVVNFVYADEQSYIYVSDLVQGRIDSNSEREIWQYQHEVPLAYQKQSSQSQYVYVPPTQKIGSNPLSKPRYKYRPSLNNNADNYTNIYNYPPSVQKVGSNPFIKATNQYVTSDNINHFFASSCGCKKSSYQDVFASY